MAFYIPFYGEVGAEVDAKTVIAAINSAKNQEIDLHMSSNGGLVFEGYAIYNALLNHKLGVNIHIEGLAASIASYIAMAGTRVYMAANALLMIHNPFSGIVGTAEDFRKQADVMDKIKNSLVDAYTRRTGLPTETILEMLDEETWLDAQTALAFGFVDAITEPLKMAASFDKAQLSKFKNCPEHLLNMATENSNGQNEQNEQNENKESTDSVNSVNSVETAKPSIFSRVSAMLKEKSDLVALNAKHEAAIGAKDKEIEGYKADLLGRHDAIKGLNAQVATFEAEKKELEETVARLEAEAKSASDEAKNIVASLGFEQANLPSPVSIEAAEAAAAAAEPKTTAEWQTKYNAIKDPAEQTAFLRTHSDKIWAAKMAEQRASKNK